MITQIRWSNSHDHFYTRILPVVVMGFVVDEPHGMKKDGGRAQQFSRLPNLLDLSADRRDSDSPSAGGMELP